MENILMFKLNIKTKVLSTTSVFFWIRYLIKKSSTSDNIFILIKTGILDNINTCFTFGKTCLG